MPSCPVLLVGCRKPRGEQQSVLATARGDDPGVEARPRLHRGDRRQRQGAHRRRRRDGDAGPVSQPRAPLRGRGGGGGHALRAVQRYFEPQEGAVRIAVKSLVELSGFHKL